MGFGFGWTYLALIFSISDFAVRWYLFFVDEENGVGGVGAPEVSLC